MDDNNSQKPLNDEATLYLCNIIQESDCNLFFLPQEPRYKLVARRLKQQSDNDASEVEDDNNSQQPLNDEAINQEVEDLDDYGADEYGLQDSGAEDENEGVSRLLY